MNSYQLGYLSIKVQEFKPVPVKDVRYVNSSRISRECVYCGCEIPKGDSYISYKPMFGKRKARCIEHSPKIYNDVERFDY